MEQQDFNMVEKPPKKDPIKRMSSIQDLTFESKFSESSKSLPKFEAKMAGILFGKDEAKETKELEEDFEFNEEELSDDMDN